MSNDDSGFDFVVVHYEEDPVALALPPIYYLLGFLQWQFQTKTPLSTIDIQ